MLARPQRPRRTDLLEHRIERLHRLRLGQLWHQRSKLEDKGDSIVWSSATAAGMSLSASAGEGANSPKAREICANPRMETKSLFVAMYDEGRGMLKDYAQAMI
jgi:hypothetical protein